MRKISIIVSAGLVLCIVLGAPFAGRETSSQTVIAEVSDADPGFTIATWNFTDLYSAEINPSRAAAIIPEFDIVVVKDIFDEASEPAIERSITAIEKTGLRYEYITAANTEFGGPRYAFIYRTEVVYPIQWWVYEDPAFDSFSSGSFIVRFEHNVKNFDFTLVCRQLDHRTSSLEIDGLRRTVRHVKTTFPDESDIIVLAGISGVWDSLEIDELLSPVTTDGYIRLFYDAPPAAAASDRCPDTHFLIASHSDALFWEEPKWVAASSASIERLTPGQPVFEQPAGFSAFVIVNDEQTEDDSERKAGCFFVSSSS